MDIRGLGVELFHVDRLTDRQTDMIKIIVVFRSFTKAPNIPQPILMFLLRLEPLAFPNFISSIAFDIKRIYAL